MILVTLWLFNIAMDNGPFIDEFPIKTSIYKGFSMAMLNNQMVITNNFCISNISVPEHGQVLTHLCYVPVSEDKAWMGSNRKRKIDPKNGI